MPGDSSPSPKITYPEWQPQLVAAMVERDREKLVELVKAAETAIFNRQQAISQSPDHVDERHAIEDALANLRILKRDRLGYPEWEKK